MSRSTNRGYVASASDTNSLAEDSRARRIVTNATEMYLRAVAVRPAKRLSQVVWNVVELYPDEFRVAEGSTDSSDPSKDEGRSEVLQASFVAALLRAEETRRDVLRLMANPLVSSEELARKFQTDRLLRLETLTMRQHGGRVEIQIELPETLNAETNQLALDLEIAVDIGTTTPGVTLGVIRGGLINSGKYQGSRVLSSGINLKHLAEGKISFLEFLLEKEVGLLRKIFSGVYDPTVRRKKDLLWVCIVDSFAIGGGLQLALACDHVILVDNAWVALPAVNEGIIPGVAPLRLRERVSLSALREILFSGRRVPSSDALSIGLVDTVCSSDELSARISDLEKQSQIPAVLANKAIVNGTVEPDDIFARYMADFAEAQAELIRSPEMLARTRNFMGGSHES